MFYVQFFIGFLAGLTERFCAAWQPWLLDQPDRKGYFVSLKLQQDYMVSVDQ